MVKVQVKILPRPEVLDAQGRSIEKVLKQNGMECDACHMGKLIVLEFHNIDKHEALGRAQVMAEKVLHNPLVEKFELEVV